MAELSQQDLKYGAEFREEIHREALNELRKLHPELNQVVDPYRVEDYFQEHWDYPGKWYTVVAIPTGCRGRKGLIDEIVAATLAQYRPPEKQQDLPAQEPPEEREPVSDLAEQYPELVVDYCLVPGEKTHLGALTAACGRLMAGWKYDLGKARGQAIPVREVFSSEYPERGVNYRKAFLYPPHGNSYSGLDFVEANRLLFPQGTKGLEAWQWTTDWSEYFDEGHEWWGALCLTIRDRKLDRFVVILASATD